MTSSPPLPGNNENRQSTTRCQSESLRARVAGGRGVSRLHCAREAAQRSDGGREGSASPYIYIYTACVGGGQNIGARANEEIRRPGAVQEAAVPLRETKSTRNWERCASTPGPFQYWPRGRRHCGGGIGAAPKLRWRHGERKQQPRTLKEVKEKEERGV